MGKQVDVPLTEARRSELVRELRQKTWSVDGFDLTGVEVIGVYEQIESGKEIANRSSRRIDRILQILRRAGLAQFRRAGPVLGNPLQFDRASGWTATPVVAELKTEHNP